MRIAILLCGVLLNVSCGKEEDSDAKSGAADSASGKSLVAIAAETAGANCAKGGTAVKSGIDDNGNGTLDTAEVKSTQYVCNGLDGTDNRIVASVGCVATLTQATAVAANLSIPVNGLSFSYTGVVMASGDVMAEASIANGSGQTSGTSFYASAQNGSSTAPVTIRDDWSTPSDNYGWWSISVNRSTAIVSTVYQDVDLPTTATRTFTFPVSACTVNNY